MGKAYAPVGLGVVGLGDAAQRTYLPGMKAFGRKYRLAAFCDLREDLAAGAAKTFGSESWHTDYDALLGRPGVEAVLVLTRTDSHFPLALKALEAGKHVYVEKTAAGTLPEFDRLIEKAGETGRVLACAPAAAAAPVCRAIKAHIDSGALGRICYVRSETSSRGPAGSPVSDADPSWFYGPEVGPLRDRGIYGLHILVRMLGPVRRVSAFRGTVMPERVAELGPSRGEKFPVAAPDSVHLLLAFDKEVMATLSATFCLKAMKGPNLEIFGDRGVLAAELHMQQPSFSCYSCDTGRWKGRKEKPWNLAMGVERFLDSVRTGSELGYPPGEARHVMEVMESAVRSAEEGRAVEIQG